MTKLNAIISNSPEETRRSDWFTEDAIAAEVSERTRNRGYSYYYNSAVKNLSATSLEATATVMGSQPYRVTFRRLNDGNIEHDCTCPVGQDYVFCKHCVAVALALIHCKVAQTHDEITPLRNYLENQSKAQLINLLLEHSEEHPALRHLLEARAAASTAKLNVEALRNTIDCAFTVDDFVDYRAMPDFYRELYPVVETLANLPENGHAKEALPLLEYALEHAFSAWESTDDSDGSMGELVEMIAQAHCRAATLAKPNSTDLANALNRLKVTSPVDFFPMEAYRDALGEEGLTHYRGLLQSEWRKVPQRNPGDAKIYYDPAGTSTYGIKWRMKELAELDEDIEALIAIESRDLSSPHHFLSVASALDEAGRHAEALDWVERGDRSFPNQVNRNIAEYLIDAYSKAGRHDDALHVAWRDYAFEPNLAKYKTLKQCADRNESWQTWRAKAIAQLPVETKTDATIPHPLFTPRNRNTETLIEIHLWENNIEAALAEARAHGCSLDLMASLAKVCEKNHLNDAVRFYKKLAADCVERRKKSSYAAAASYIRKIGHLLAGAKRRGEFEAYLSEIKSEHRAKKIFMAALGVSCGIS